MSKNNFDFDGSFGNTARDNVMQYQLDNETGNTLTVTKVGTGVSIKMLSKSGKTLGEGTFDLGQGTTINNIILDDSQQKLIISYADGSLKYCYLSDLYDHFPTKLSDLENDKNYATQEYVIDKCAEKVDLPNEPVEGQGVNVPYYFDTIYNADSILVRDYTINLLDKEEDPKQFSLTINSATSEKAGLMSAADKVALGNKQDIISDLSTIRAGAALGATAYQKPGNGIIKSDLNSSVQASLDKADTALQEHQSLADYRKAAEQDVIDNAIKDRVTAIEGKEATWDAKQDAISDLATIRSGAALGATAIQTHQDISGKANITYVDTEVAKKQDIITDSEKKDLINAVTEAGYIMVPKINQTTAGTYNLVCVIDSAGTVVYKWAKQA